LKSKTFAITCGDINGIGPEIAIRTINYFSKKKFRFVLFIPKNVFIEIQKLVPLNFTYQIISNVSDAFIINKKVNVIDIGDVKLTKGKPTKDSGEMSVKAIREAYQFCKVGICDAMITAPISKTAWEYAGIKHPGQTELLGKLDNNTPMMMFLSDIFNCALFTIHEPIKNVAKLLTKKSLETFIRNLINNTKDYLGVKKPKIAVLALNPHAGEDGRIGSEEFEIIKPIINRIPQLNIFGPFVPDAFFATNSFKNYDVVLGIYHDQILIPFKMLAFNKGVNFTAGLEIIRVSPDHGTAFDIAWNGKADSESMINSVLWAEKIVDNYHRRK
jgi:4-hydroxythreonine-4-phosphate dehydrogenase